MPAVDYWYIMFSMRCLRNCVFPRGHTTSGSRIRILELSSYQMNFRDLIVLSVLNRRSIYRYIFFPYYQEHWPLPTALTLFWRSR